MRAAFSEASNLASGNSAFRVASVSRASCTLPFCIGQIDGCGEGDKDRACESRPAFVPSFGRRLHDASMG